MCYPSNPNLIEIVFALTPDLSLWETAWMYEIQEKRSACIQLTFEKNS